MYFREECLRLWITRWWLRLIFLFPLFSLVVVISGCTATVCQIEADRQIREAQYDEQNGQCPEALDHYQQALPLTRENPQKQAALLYNMGNCEQNLQEYEQAIEHYRESLKFSHPKEYYIKTLNNIGVIYRYLGQYAEALEYFNQALTMRPAALTQPAKEDFTLQLNQAAVLIKLKQPQRALKILEYLLTFQKNITYQYEIALTYAIRGILEATDFPERTFRNLPQALADHQHALSIFKELQKEADLAFTYHNIGWLYAEQQDYPTALEYYQKALSVSVKIHDAETAWLTYYNMGNTYSVRSDSDNARQNYERAIQIIESIRSKLNIDDFKLSFMEDKSKVYQALINLLWEQGEAETAFNYLERAKSRALVDLLSARPIRPRQELKPDALQAREQIEQQIQALLYKLGVADANPQKQRTVVAGLTKELNKAKGNYQQLLAENPEYASLISVNSFPQIKEIQKRIPERTALLEYCLLEDKVLIFILTSGTLHVEAVTVPQKCLQGTILAWRMEIEREMPGWQAKSHWLYSQLIWPAEKYLDGIDMLCIIPQGSLHDLPFGALLIDEPQTGSDHPGKLLLERYNLFYAPSATVLQFAFDKGNKHSSPDFTQKNQQNQCLIVANPDLACAQEEAEGIQQSYPYPQTTILVGSEATKATVKMFAANSRLIHFATHGMLDSAHPLFSALALANGDFLAVYEIFNDLTLEQNNLVTLSACNTALGKMTAGDEIIGLTRAFLYAGAPSIIASLWAVDDRSTALLMQRFYKNFSMTDNKAESLRRAQVCLLHDAAHPVFQHPYYWAAFELIGDYR